MRACVRAAVFVYLCLAGWVPVLSMLRIAGSISVHNVSTATCPSSSLSPPASELPPGRAMSLPCSCACPRHNLFLSIAFTAH